MTDRGKVSKDDKQQILARIDDFSFAFSDLDRQRPSASGWVQACCPFHDDSTPSFAFHRETGRWRCFAGCGHGDIFDYLERAHGEGFRDALRRLAERAGVARPALDRPPLARPPIREALVEQWAEYLQVNDGVRRWIREHRGLGEPTLKKYQIGWDPKRERIAIPIRDEHGELANIRLYDADSPRKIIHFTDGPHGYGSPPRLFGVDELGRSDGQVILCEGEWDRLLLQQEDFPAVTGTHGAEVFLPDWLPRFAGRDVVVLYDCDPVGIHAARKVAQALGTAGVASLRNVTLPLRGDKDDKDVTDFLHGHGHAAADLRRLIDETPTVSDGPTPPAQDVLDLDSFVDIERREVVDRKVRCQITVCGETSESFHAVERFQVTACPRMARGGCLECKGVGAPAVIPRGAQEHIGSCMSTNLQLKAMLREYACRQGQRPVIEILDRTPVKEFICHQRVNRIAHIRGDGGQVATVIDGRQQELLEKRVYYLSSQDPPRPGNYLAEGWVKTDPRSQQITFLIDSMTPLEDDFETFRVDDNLEHLRAFQALSWAEVVEDLTENVTRVYERDDILRAILLTYCSPLSYAFNGEPIRGWLVTVIIGDSGSGKTRTHQRLAEFVNIGDCFSGLTGSRTGLAYALVEHRQKGWQVRIGRYPANSRRILTVDEAQHLSPFDTRAARRIPSVLLTGPDSDARSSLPKAAKSSLDEVPCSRRHLGCLGGLAPLPGVFQGDGARQDVPVGQPLQRSARSLGVGGRHEIGRISARTDGKGGTQAADVVQQWRQLG